MDLRIAKKILKILKIWGRRTSPILIVLLILGWLFGGWPVVWKNFKIKEAKAQGLNVKVGSFAKITTTGSQTITGLGFQPKAIIFYWSRNTANATAAVPRSQGVGFTDCTNQRAVAIAEDDNAGTSNAGRYRTESNVIVILSNGNPTVGSRATFTSCNTDGFTINWAVSEARADIINYIAIGGPDVTNVRAGTFTLAATTGIQNITGVGFQPDFVMFLWGFTENVDTASAGLEMGMGFADYSNNQGSILNCVRDNQANNSTKYSQQRTDNVVLLSDLTCVQDALAAFNGFTSDGFQLNVSDAPAAATPIFYLAIKGGSHAVGNFLQPTTTGTQTISGTGFQPNLVVLFSRNQAAGTGLTAPSTFSIGAANATTSRAGVWGQSRNVDPSQTAVYTDNTKIIIMRTLTGTGGAGTINAQADFAGFTSNGFQLNWTTVDTTQRQIIYWAFGPSPTFNQSAYRFFNNLDSTNVGTPLANQDTPATLTSSGQAFRLRLLLHVTNKLTLNGQSFKLQFAQRGADGLCDTSFSGETYIDVTTSTVIAFYDNPTPTDGSSLTANANDPVHNTDTIRNQTYEELNPFTNSVSVINSGEDGKWDFSLIDNGAPPGATYCFRVVKADGTLLDSYSVIPEITTVNIIQSAYRFFQNIDSTDVGTPLANQNTPATLSSAGQVFRLRLLLHASSSISSPTSSNSLIISGLNVENRNLRIGIKAVSPFVIFVAFGDATAQDLIFCKTTNGGISWSCNTIESTGNIGFIPSLDALDENNIFIAHRDVTNNNLRVCISSNGGTSFNCSAVETGGWDSSIKALSTSTIFVSHSQNFGTYSVLRFCRTDNGGSTWNCSTPEGNNTNFYGWYTSLDAVDSNNIYLSHHDGGNQDLRFCRSNNGGTSWSCNAIETAGDIGRYPSLKAFSTNYIYISHLDFTNSQLRFCRTANGGNTWVCGNIEASSDLPSSLDILDRDAVYVLHYNFTNDLLRLCRTNDGGSTWSCQTISNISSGLTDVNQAIIGLSLIDSSMIYATYGFNDPTNNIRQVRIWKYTGSVFLKLQYSVRSGTCDVNFSGENYQDVTFNTPIAFYNNDTTTDSSTSTSNTNDPVHNGHSNSYQSYKEKRFFSNLTSINLNSDGLWDFVLRDNGAPPNTTYCLRVVTANDSLLAGYEVIPEITTSLGITQSAYRFFQNIDSTDVGTPLANQNTPATLSSAGQAFRLRLLLHASSSISYPWINSAVETANNVGRYTSIDAIDANTIFISHYDYTNGDLRFCKSTNGGSTWTCSAVDTANNVGWYTSIKAIDANTIFISHYDYTNGDLRFCKSTNGGSTWTCSAVETANIVGWYTSIDAIDANTIFISHYDDTNGDLRFCKSTNGGSTWTCSAVDTANNVGRYTSIDAIDANTIFISHYDSTNEDLRFCKSTNGGSTWTCSAVDTANTVGYDTSIKAIDANTIFISHSDATNGDLRFCKSTNGGSTWTCSAVDTANNVGWYTSIDAIDANTIFISHYDYTNGDLRFCKSTNGGSTWSCSAVDTANDVGWYTSIKAIDANTIFISHYDYTNGDLRFTKAKFQTFKLQFAQRGSDNQCDTNFIGETYTDVTTSTVIAFYDNPTPTDESPLTANANDPTHGNHTIRNQTYEELNPFTNSVSEINPGEDGKWDFSLKDNGAPPNTTYCFRVVKADGTLLDYSVIPEITTSLGITQSAYRFFQNIDSTDVGTPLANQNTPATLSSAGQAFRLRLLLHASSSISYPWINSAVETANNVGLYTSIDAIDANTIFISHYDYTYGDLRFCKSTNGGSTWTCSAVESTNYVGLYTSIKAIDANTIFISHYDYTNGDLRFCKSTNGGSTWTCSAVDTANDVGLHTSIDAIDANTIFISHYDDTNGDLRFCKSTNGGSTWTCSAVDTANDVGWETSIKAIDANTIFISHYDDTNGDLRFCKSTNGGSTWTCSAVDTANDVGWETSIDAIDANTIFISHYDATNGDLRFCKSTNGGSNWTCSAVDTANNVGRSTSIDAIDANTIFISHSDVTNGDLRFCKSTNGGSTWTCSAVDTANNVGWYTSIKAIDANTIFISHYDATNGDLRFAKANFQTFKLQFATSTGSCATTPNGNYVDVTTSTVIAFYDNPTPTDESPLTANANDPTHGNHTIRNQTYEELNPFTNSVSEINPGEDGKWDFSLKDNGAPPGTTYCFRVVKADGTLLDYSVIPEITTSLGITQSAYRFFQNIDSTDVGTPLANQNTPATLSSAGQAFRLRLLLHASSSISYPWINSAVETANNVGWYTSIDAIDANTIFISHSDATNGDLRFCKSTNGGSTWTCSAVDTANTVGYDTSIKAIDANTIFISHYDFTNEDLRFCKSTNGGSTWTCSAVDTANDVGWETSIDAIDANTIFISHYDYTNGDLRFCKSTNGGSTWTCSAVDTANNVGRFTSIDAIDANTIFISHYDATNGDLRFCKSTNGGSTWTCSAVDTANDVGWETSIKAIDANTIFISHYDFTNGDLRFCKSTNGGSNWTCSAVDTANNVGRFTSIDAIDANTIFISHYDYTNGDLRFCKSTNGGSTWTCSAVDTANNVGLSTSIKAIDANTIFISHYDYTNGDLRFTKAKFQTFKLQFAQRGSDNQCDTNFIGETYTDVTTSTVIAFYDNPTPTDESPLTANANDPTHGNHTIRNQTYEELNPFTNSVSEINPGEDGKWDFSLKDNGAPPNTTYCFRVVKADGTLLDSYSVIPEITTASAGAVTCTLSATSTSFSALSLSAVSTSSPDITITITSGGGFQINVRDAGNGTNPGLYKSSSPTYLIQSQDATLSAGTDGYGIQATTTNPSISINPKYNKSGNDVGGLSLTDVVLATSSAAVSNATINIKHKASVSVLAPTGSYQDTITYTCSSL